MLNVREAIALNALTSRPDEQFVYQLNGQEFVTTFAELKKLITNDEKTGSTAEDHALEYYSIIGATFIRLVNSQNS